MAAANEPERSSRISIPNISATAVRWYLSVFNLLTIYLTVTNTVFAAAQQNANSWQAIQYIATGELLKAGGVALIVSPIIAEGLKMVLAEILSERRIRKATAKAVQENQAKWEAWLQRRQDAADKGIPFDEPPPQPESTRQGWRKWF